VRRTPKLDAGDLRGRKLLLVAIPVNDHRWGLEVHPGNLGSGEALAVAVFEDDYERVVIVGRWRNRFRNGTGISEQEDYRNGNHSDETAHKFLQNGQGRKTPHPVN
jgi:hypothetical protein